MDRKVRVWGKGLLALALVASLGLVGCGDPEEAARLAKEAAQAEAWSAIETAQTALNTQRQELSDLQEKIAQAAAEGSEVTEEELAGWKTQATELTTKVTNASEELNTLAIKFINDAELVQGEEIPERVKAAIRIKTDGDMAIAREYIDEGGDYGRALDIYQAALVTDPDNQKLKDAIASAEELRWMSKERFDLAKKGMLKEEVKAVLGPVNSRRIQDYPDKKVTAWFYPKGPEQGAAAVYFQQKGEGEYKVYKVDFNAAKPKKTQ